MSDPKYSDAGSGNGSGRARPHRPRRRSPPSGPSDSRPRSRSRSPPASEFSAAASRVSTTRSVTASRTSGPRRPHRSHGHRDGSASSSGRYSRRDEDDDDEKSSARHPRPRRRHGHGSGRSDAAVVVRDPYVVKAPERAHRDDTSSTDGVEEIEIEGPDYDPARYRARRREQRERERARKAEGAGTGAWALIAGAMVLLSVLLCYDHLFDDDDDD